MDITQIPGLKVEPGNDSARFDARVAGEDTDPRLLEAAQDFEAMLLESWWRSMKETFGKDEGEVGGEAMDDLGIQAMSTAIAGAGGLGIATALLEQLRAAIPESPGADEPETNGSPDSSGEDVQSGENS